MKESSLQRSMLLNTAGSLIYYACQWFMTVVIVRVSGYSAAGVLSIAMTVTASPSIVSLFNVRSYQVSDLNGQYKASTYMRSRTFTNAIAYLICLVMLIAGGYTGERAAAILVFMLFKVVEGYADVLYGMEQKHGRLDISGISLAIRGVGTIVLFTGILMATDQLLLGLAAVILFSAFVICVYDARVVSRWKELKESSGQVWRLLWTCVPLAVVAFLNNLSFNMPKIVLENRFGSELMGYYSSVASPTLVVQLAATTIFAPLVPPLTRAFLDHEKERFYGILQGFALLLLALAVVCLVGGRLLGHWGLTLLFGEGIEPYVCLFVPIVFISIILAVNATLFSICTLLREIRSQYWIGVLGILASVVSSEVLVPVFAVEGVLYAQTLTITVQIVIQIVIIVHKLRRSL